MGIKISVITPTNRLGGIDIAYKSLKKQTFKDFEWVLVDSHCDNRRKIVDKYVKDMNFIHINEPPKKKGSLWNLNAAYNQGFRWSKGELIISYQDFIWLPGDGLQKFWDLYQEYPDTFISGIGNKAKYPDKIDNKGYITLWNKPYKGRPTGISELDNRVDGGKELIDSNYSFFELNWSSFPREAVDKLGGFDEQLDYHYGGDNVHFALRASLLGYKFKVDKSNECIGFNQDALFPRPDDWEEKHVNKGFLEKEIKRLII